MSILIVDASVAVKWFIEEDHADAALSLLNERHQLHAPDFLLLEGDSVLCKWARLKLISLAEGDDIREALRRYPIHTHEFTTLLDSAYTIANETQASVYDCLYVALAALLKGKVITADQKLCELMAGGPFAEYVTWLEHLA